MVDGHQGSPRLGSRQVVAFPWHRKIFGLHDTADYQYVLGNQGHAYSLMKRRTRSGLRLMLLLFLVGGVYLVMHRHRWPSRPRRAGSRASIPRAMARRRAPETADASRRPSP